MQKREANVRAMYPLEVTGSQNHTIQKFERKRIWVVWNHIKQKLDFYGKLELIGINLLHW